MSNARWDRIQDLYHAALERPASARAAFLREACEGDSALLHEVQSLLDQPISAEQFLVSGESGADDETPSVRMGQRLGVYQVQAAPTEKSVLVVAVNVTADDGYPSGR